MRMFIRDRSVRLFTRDYSDGSMRRLCKTADRRRTLQQNGVRGDLNVSLNISTHLFWTQKSEELRNEGEKEFSVIHKQQFHSNLSLKFFLRDLLSRRIFEDFDLDLDNPLTFCRRRGHSKGHSARSILKSGDSLAGHNEDHSEGVDEALKKLGVGATIRMSPSSPSR